MLHYAVNDGMSSFDWRFIMFSDVFTTGRGLTYIERNQAGTPINLFHLDPKNVTIKLSGGRKTYEYQEQGKALKVYQASDVIDVPFMMQPDGVGHIGPVTAGKDAFRLCINVMAYANKFLANGGVPAFAVTGNFQTSQALKRAADDLEKAVSKASKEERQALTLPAGLEIKSIGSDPDKNQMIETQRWCVEQIARLYGLPPTFLQDLTHGTFSNTEQQDLHFVKHTLRRWVEQFEQELNLKLFGRASNTRYVELNVDGLLRGDFGSRMDGYATGITHGFLKPSEVRMLENWPAEEGADQLFIQGATVPIDQAGQQELPLGNDDGI
jgi:HK97 family phage portal protein